MTTARIALANLRYPATRDESVTLAERAIADAGAAGARVVCFPECYVPGYRWPGRDLLPPDATFLEAAWARIAAAARKAGITVILGTERFVGGALKLTALVINSDGTVAGFQDKAQLDPSEDAIYTPGEGRTVFRAGDLTFGVVICHEGWRYPETTRACARLGAQVVFHPHYAPYEGGYVPKTFADPANTFHEKAILCRAAENTVYFASVNCAEDRSGITSAVAGPDGAVLAWQPYGKEGLLIVDLDLEKATGMLAGRLRDHQRASA